MNPTPKGNEPIDLKKMLADIDLRFVSGNNMPVERAHIRAWEWDEILRVLNEYKSK